MLQDGSFRPTQPVQEASINDKDGGQVAINNTHTTQGKPNTSDFMNPVPIKHLLSTDFKKP